MLTFVEFFILLPSHFFSTFHLAFTLEIKQHWNQKSLNETAEISILVPFKEYNLHGKFVKQSGESHRNEESQYDNSP